jgi:hypothetical protein
MRRRMQKTRRAVAVTCIALIALAAFLPSGGASLAWLALTPVFALLPPVTTSVVRREVVSCGQRSVALLGILDSRGPPTSSSLA